MYLWKFCNNILRQSVLFQIASLEGQNALKHNISVDLSPQELVDCSTRYGNRGCNGGWMDYGFSYIKDHGISTLADYEYTGKDGKCKTVKNSSGIKLTGFHDIEHNEASLKEAVGTYFVKILVILFFFFITKKTVRFFLNYRHCWSNRCSHQR